VRGAELIPRLERLARHGDAVVAWQLAEYYAQRLGGESQAVRSRQVADWCCRAAVLGNPAARYRLALLYQEGRLLPRCLPLAVSWLSLAADQGHSDAQVLLGWCLQRGIGAAMREDRARAWYLRAATAGQVQARYNLGRMYEKEWG